MGRPGAFRFRIFLEGVQKLIFENNCSTKIKDFFFFLNTIEDWGMNLKPIAFSYQ